MLARSRGVDGHGKGVFLVSCTVSFTWRWHSFGVFDFADDSMTRLVPAVDSRYTIVHRHE